MKKYLTILGMIVAVGISSAAIASPYGYLSAPNEGNRNFRPLMQHQFERNETLDFTNHPEEYKEKRENKDAYLDYKEGKTNELPASMKPKIDLQSSRDNGYNGMQFIKDENGNIKIQGIK